MTAHELLIELDKKYGLHENWPKDYEVDHETYANCCQAIFEHLPESMYGYIRVFLGLNKGLMFKNVELILRRIKV